MARGGVLLPVGFRAFRLMNVPRSWQTGLVFSPRGRFRTLPTGVIRGRHVNPDQHVCHGPESAILSIPPEHGSIPLSGPSSHPQTPWTLPSRGHLTRPAPSCRPSQAPLASAMSFSTAAPPRGARSQTPGARPPFPPSPVLRADSHARDCTAVLPLTHQPRCPSRFFLQFRAFLSISVLLLVIFINYKINLLL